MKTAHPNNRVMAVIFLITVGALLAACGTGEAQIKPPSGQEAQPTSAQEPPAPQPAPGEDACLAGIVPGQTTRDEVIAALGEPDSSETAEETGDETLTFAADDQAFPVSIVVREGIAVLIGVSVDEQAASLSEWLDRYGQPEGTTFSNFMLGAMTYLYPTRGTAFVVLPENNLVFYQQCVQPTTLEEYMATWGAELPLENPYRY